MCNLDSMTDEIIIIGDLNFDQFDLVNKGKPLKDFCNSHGLVNTISKGTRRNPITNNLTLLDVILCYSLGHFLKSEVFRYPDSDHFLTISIFKHNSLASSKSNQIESRCLNRDKILQLKELLFLIFSISYFRDVTDVESCWFTIKTAILVCLDTIAPLKKMNVKIKNIVSWYDKELVILSKKRNRLYNKASHTNLQDDWAMYKRTRKHYKTLFRRKKIEHFNNILKQDSTSSPILWKKLNPYLNPNKQTKIEPSFFSTNNQLSLSPQDISNMFSNFFSSVTNRFTFVDRNICLSYIDGIFNKANSVNQLKNTNSFDFSTITKEEVLKALKSMKNSASGATGIDSKVFIECADELAEPITFVFNLSIQKNTIPDQRCVIVQFVIEFQLQIT